MCVAFVGFTLKSSFNSLRAFQGGANEEGFDEDNQNDEDDGDNDSVPVTDFVPSQGGSVPEYESDSDSECLPSKGQYKGMERDHRAQSPGPSHVRAPSLPIPEAPTAVATASRTSTLKADAVGTIYRPNASSGSNVQSGTAVKARATPAGSMQPPSAASNTNAKRVNVKGGGDDDAQSAVSAPQRTKGAPNSLSTEEADGDVIHIDRVTGRARDPNPKKDPKVAPRAMAPPHARAGNDDRVSPINPLEILI
jgi:biotin carboxyl carrier protein